MGLGSSFQWHLRARGARGLGGNVLECSFVVFWTPSWLGEGSKLEFWEALSESISGHVGVSKVEFHRAQLEFNRAQPELSQSSSGVQQSSSGVQQSSIRVQQSSTRVQQSSTELNQMSARAQTELNQSSSDLLHCLTILCANYFNDLFA